MIAAPLFCTVGRNSFSSQALLWVSAQRDEAARRLSTVVAQRIEAALRPEVRMLGPDEAPIRRLQGRFRQMILLRAPSQGPIQNTLRQALAEGSLRLGKGERIAVDIDPYSLL